MGRNVEIHSVSLYQFHSQWVEGKKDEDDFNFSKWVRSKIEEEAEDAPVFIET